MSDVDSEEIRVLTDFGKVIISLHSKTLESVTAKGSDFSRLMDSGSYLLVAIAYTHFPRWRKDPLAARWIITVQPG